MTEACVVAAVRTPIGRHGGALSADAAGRMVDETAELLDAGILYLRLPVADEPASLGDGAVPQTAVAVD